MLSSSSHLVRRALQGVALLAALPVATLAQAAVSLAQTTGQQPVVIRGGWLFTATGNDVVRNQGVLIVGGRLVAVNRPITAGETTGARIVDLADDEYVLPGIFDVHAHYNMTLGADGIRSDEYTYNPLIFLANGVTSTFPGGEYDPEGMMAARKRIDAGEQVGPRIYNSGPYFGTARRGWNQNATQAAYTKFNARLSLNGADDRWELAVIGRNLADKQTLSYAGDTPLSSRLFTVRSYYGFVDAPRSLAIEGMLRF